MNWDDLRFFLALARAGTLSKAAQRLGVSHSTVARRMEAFADTIGAALFERYPEGFVLTAAGHELLPIAAEIEAEVSVAQRLLTGRDTRLSGELTITTVDALVDLFMPWFASFMRCYPDIELNLVVDNHNRDMTRREADIALRVTNNPPEHLIGRCLMTLSWALMASSELATRLQDCSIAEYPMILWTHELDVVDTNAWFRREIGGHPVARVNTGQAMRHFVQASLGVALLPTLFAELWDVVAIGPVIDSFDTDLWILTHADLRRTARVSAFLAHMSAFVRTAPTARPPE